MLIEKLQSTLRSIKRKRPIKSKRLTDGFNPFIFLHENDNKKTNILKGLTAWQYIICFRLELYILNTIIKILLQLRI